MLSLHLMKYNLNSLMVVSCGSIRFYFKEEEGEILENIENSVEEFEPAESA